MILDSDIIIYFLKGKQDVIENILSVPKDKLYTTRINYSELLYGAYNSLKVEQNLKTIKQFLQELEILEYDEKSANIFAQLKAKLKARGNLIADMDLMIASISIANNETLYTNNLKHFERIDNLELKLP